MMTMVRDDSNFPRPTLTQKAIHVRLETILWMKEVYFKIPKQMKIKSKPFLNLSSRSCFVHSLLWRQDTWQFKYLIHTFTVARGILQIFLKTPLMYQWRPQYH